MKPTSVAVTFATAPRAPRARPVDTGAKRARRIETLRVIVRLSSEKGFPPTLQEIGDALGLAAKSAVRARIRSLYDDGLVTCEWRLSRTLRVTEMGLKLIGAKQAA